MTNDQRVTALASFISGNSLSSLRSKYPVATKALEKFLDKARSTDPRRATAAEIEHLIGFVPDHTNIDKAIEELDALNVGIEYTPIRNAWDVTYDLAVEYTSLPTVYRDDMLAIGVTLPHLY